MTVPTCLLLHQVRAHQLVLPPCEVVIKAVSEYVSSIKDLGNLDAIARDVFKQSQVSRESGPVCLQSPHAFFTSNTP